MLGLTEFPRIGDLPYFLTLPGYAFYWFKLQHAATPIAVRVAPEQSSDLPLAPALFMGAAWDTLLEGNVRTLIERDLLVSFLQRQRWFGAKARPMRAARFVDWGLLRRAPQPLFLTLVEAEFEDGGRDRYFLPLTICAHADVRGLDDRAPHAVLATITGARKGVLFDAWLDDRFARVLLEALERQDHVKTRRGSIQALQTDNFPTARGQGDLVPRRLSAEQSNTSLVYGDRLILKLFRRIEPGINPDFEIGRQLTEKAGFSRVPAVAGALEHTGVAEAPATIAMLQQLVESQADGWSHATDDVDRYYDLVEGRPMPAVEAPRSYTALMRADVPPVARDTIGGYLRTAETLGRRTAEMHLALASDSSNAAFAPEPFTANDLASVGMDATAQAQAALVSIERMGSASPLLERRQQLLDAIHPPPALEFTAAKIRVHGDYHLGQVLWSEGDFYILDFEGEPARPLAQRRTKQSPLKDVAGMMRSFSYAAYAGLFAHTVSRPAAFDTLAPWADLWATWTTAAFLRGYFSTVGNALFVPQQSHQRDELLRLFVLGKALYELNYELNNRPDWLRIPLSGILRLID
jgi:maltose alpha-D-glucosyltransferase/alpha-amylase